LLNSDQTPNSTQTRAGVSNAFRRPARLFFIFAVFVFLIAAFFGFPRQKACGPDCVVLIGDSITSKWQGLTQTKQLSGLQIINRGIPGDFTSHMLSRFNHDVVQLRPRVVVILGGTNDIVQIPLPSIEQNLASLAETAEQHGIRVVLATLAPTGEYDPDQPCSAEISGHNGVMSGRDEIQTLNNWIRNFANQKHYTLVDYHSALADDRGYYLKGLTTDGVHPSVQGYERMEPLLRKAIQSAIRDGR
jgi:lysophospholipase L1-like esterase